MSAKVCFVTGSGRRIGASIIRKFAEEGYAVLIHVSSSIDSGESLKSELLEKGLQADLLQSDLTDEKKTSYDVCAMWMSAFGPVIVED